MENFTFSNSTKIIFGKGTENGVGAEAARYGKKVLLHYGGGSIKTYGLYDWVLKSLKDTGPEVIELGVSGPIQDYLWLKRELVYAGERK